MKSIKTKMCVSVTFRYDKSQKDHDITRYYDAFERELVKCSRRAAKNLSVGGLTILVESSY